MKWIHAAFEPARGIYLWGEGPVDDPSFTTIDLRKWPFALDSEGLQRLVFDVFRLRPNKFQTWTGSFPTGKNQALPSTNILVESPEGRSSSILVPWKVPVAGLPPEKMFALLSSIDQPRIEPGIFCSSDLLYWAQLLRLSLHLIVTQKYVPSLRNNCAYWRPVLLGEDKRHFYDLVALMPPSCRAFTEGPPGGWYLASRFVEYVLNETVRHSAPAFSAASNTVHDRWLLALHDPQSQSFGTKTELVDFDQSLKKWSTPLLRRTAFEYRLAFRLQEPTAKRDFWYLRFFLQKENEPTLLIPLEKIWKGSRSALQLFGESLMQIAENALVALGQAAKVDSNIEYALMNSQPAGYQMDTQAAWEFMNVKAWLLQDAGYGVMLPSWWGRKESGLRLAVRAKPKGPKKAFNGTASNVLVNFDWQLAIGENRITYEEFMALARLKVPLIKFHGRWIELRPEQIKAASEFWKSRSMEQGNLSDLLRMLSGTVEMAGGLPVAEVEATGWLSQFIYELETHAKYRLITVPPLFKGKLRDYQHRGYSWLDFLKTYGLGACLADDMGLGKTIQSIALMLRDRQEGANHPILLICPTSVVGNWQRELERFAPSLKVLIHHGTSRAKAQAFAAEAENYDVVLSSYSLLLRDIASIGEMRWRAVILDEAQNIKNAETKQARAARSLQADYRIALTGTPVENNIGELWSIFEFLNPGLLGTRAEFKEKFYKPIHTESNEAAIERLKQLTGPFLLRRLKTDREIMSELPKKMEMKVFCNLTAEQASLYAAVVKSLEKDLEEAEGIERKGKILASISKLKQICNHPAHFLMDGSPLQGRSGKLMRLGEMMEEVLAVRDRVLIFTQFVEMGKLLKNYLQNYFGEEVAFLHGGIPRAGREKMVRCFNEDPQGPPIFLLSLKAGGTGLNLARANHVFHFDRWWNPAVEDQATDRAYRIGQTKNVQVHKMVCVGTLEERIDEMIERKKSVAGSIIGTGEAWLTELSTTEIKALIALGNDAVSV